MELKDIELKFGDKVTLTNGAIISVDAHAGDSANELYPKAVKIERPVKYETIYEAPNQILTKEEKEYLEYIIRPFREYTTTINKTTGFYDQYIIIDLTYNNNSIRIPIIQSNMKFEGMELYKKYSLKELGLFEGE